MQEINNGDFENLELVIIKNGQEINADDDVLVNIYDADDLSNTVLSSGSATNEPQNGLYVYEVGPDITSLNRVLRAEWTYSISGQEITKSSFHQVVNPYTTVSDIVDYYNYGVKPSDVNYIHSDEIRRAERLARTVINGYTGQQFGKRHGFQEVFATGSDAVFLTEPMLSIEKMYENDILVIDNTVDPAYNSFGFEIELTQTKKTIRIVNVDWDVRYDNNIDPSVLYYGRFRNHSRYKFEGVIGWNYVPTDIKLAATLLAGDYLANDAAWRIKYLSEVSMSEVSFKMRSGAYNGTGNLLVDNILDQYRNTGIVVI